MRTILLTLLFFCNYTFAQNLKEGELKIHNDGNWIQYAIPRFMANITSEDNMSPHYFRYDFQSNDKKVNIFILINNSSKYKFELRDSYEAQIKNKDLKLTYKAIKEDKYFLSGRLTNGRILYEFCKVKGWYGYTYSIEYDEAYSDYFNSRLPDIIKNFKIL